MGKESRSSTNEIEHDFSKRVSQWGQIELVQLTPPKKEFSSREEQQKAEMEIFSAKLATMKGFQIVLLHETGKQYTSEQFSHLISTSRQQAESLCFVIGGASGFAKEMLAISHYRKMSLSPMTFPHHIARLLLVEQIYRAFTIIAGHPYHK
jgi:23S rRNA (pseudouridine1915-N3)-methyltransferase